MSYYVHNVPGRLRIKIPTLRGQAGSTNALRQLLEGLHGVDNITVNGMTGSIVVNYDPDAIVPEQILSILKENNYIHEIKSMKQDHLQVGLSRSGEAIGKALFGWAVGKMLENTGLSFLAVLV